MKQELIFNQVEIHLSIADRIRVLFRKTFWVKTTITAKVSDDQLEIESSVSETVLRKPKIMIGAYITMPKRPVYVPTKPASDNSQTQ